MNASCAAFGFETGSTSDGRKSCRRRVHSAPLKSATSEFYCCATTPDSCKAFTTPAAIEALHCAGRRGDIFDHPPLFALTMRGYTTCRENCCGPHPRLTRRDSMWEIILS